MKHCLPKGVGALRHRWQRVHRGRRARRLPQRICLLCPSWPGGGLSVLFVKFSYFSVLFLYFAYLSVCLRFLSIHPPMDLLYVSSLSILILSVCFSVREKTGDEKNGSRDDKRSLLYQNIPFFIFILTEELEKLSIIIFILMEELQKLSIIRCETYQLRHYSNWKSVFLRWKAIIFGE